MPTSPKPGPRNDLTDVAGLRVGHATDATARSGVTVVLCPGLTTAAVDCRGGAPATRETDAMAPDRLIGGAHAIVLSGGSVFGLAAADAVATRLSARGVGVSLRPGAPPAPLVPAASLYDLAAPGAKDWGGSPPYARLGAEALAAAEGACGAAIALGAVGAGRGATAGRLKGGIGAASLDLGDGVTAAALVAVNSFGATVMPETGCFWAWPFEIEGEFGARRPPADAPPAIDPAPADAKAPQPGANTTVGVVATNAALSRPELQRLSMMAQDGLARALRPAHAPFDGDTLFALATAAAPLCPQDASRDLALTRLGTAAADCVARAIARGVHAARAEPDEAPAWRDRYGAP